MTEEPDETFVLTRAEYPQRTCREAVWGEHGQVYQCELPDLHPGPHATQSSLASLEARQRWEEANPGWQERIGSSDIIV